MSIIIYNPTFLPLFLVFFWFASNDPPELPQVEILKYST